jgi:hypothetical protein
MTTPLAFVVDGCSLTLYCKPACVTANVAFSDVIPITWGTATRDVARPAVVGGSSGPGGNSGRPVLRVVVTVVRVVVVTVDEAFLLLLHAPAIPASTTTVPTDAPRRVNRPLIGPRNLACHARRPHGGPHHGAPTTDLSTSRPRLVGRA